MPRIILAFLLAFAFPAAAQYPERPVTMLTGYPAGGLVDVVARLVADQMKPKFPRGLVVQIKPGAAGSVAVTELVRAQPDGYTFILTPHSALVIAAQLQDLAYKTPDDYLPFINLVSYFPMIAVRTESPTRPSTGSGRRRQGEARCKSASARRARAPRAISTSRSSCASPASR